MKIEKINEKIIKIKKLASSLVKIQNPSFAANSSQNISQHYRKNLEKKGAD